jgi:hypothetical protein
MNTKQIHTLLHRCGLGPHKENLVLGMSDGRTTHVSELMPQEAKKLTDYLQAQANTIAAAQDQRSQRADKMRKKIISMAYDMGWTVIDTGRAKADMPRINAWVLKYGYLHKPLNQYTYHELPNLLHQYEQLHIKALEK